MHKLRIGLVVSPENDPTVGGGYSYYNTLLTGINEFIFSPEIEIINIVFYKGVLPTKKFTKPSIYIKEGVGFKIKQLLIKHSKSSTAATITKRNSTARLIYKFLVNKRNKRAEQILRENNIDFVYYLKQHESVFNYPSIATVWDVGHKSTNGFPEQTLNRNYESREQYYLYSLNKAFLILCESEAGANELKKYYSLYANKVKIMPLFGSNTIRHKVLPNIEHEILKKFHLEKENFFFYPAQFWPHKNHYNLIIAFSKLIQETNHKNIKLVLCGSDKGNFKYIEEIIKSLSLTSKVIMPGFVSDDVLVVFYQNAIALTLPTFLGPTNIPIIEAAHLCCPVLCSDLAGHREILADNALYFDPSSSEEIKSAMEIMLIKNTRETMIASAKNHIVHSRFNLYKSLECLNRIFKEIIPIRKTWGIDYILTLTIIVCQLY